MAAGLIVGLMTVIALGGLWSQNDLPLSVEFISSLLTLVVALGFVLLQIQIVKGRPTVWLRAAGVVVIVLSIANVRFSDTWAMLGVAAAAAALVMPRFGWLAALVTLLAGTALTAGGQATPTAQVAIPLISLVVAVGLEALTRLAQALTDLRVSREQLARLQVDRERNRISRDLHDIVGRTLVAASLRIQAAAQLLDRDIEGTRAQLERAHQALVDGQADLRRLTSGPITTTLADELKSARALCDRLRIHLTVEASAESVEDSNSLAARVVREGITNMLKHSNARACEVRIATAPVLDVTITNDGRPPTAKEDPSLGTGLADLHTRLETAGLGLTAGPVGPDGFRLHVGVPERFNGGG